MATHFRAIWVFHHPNPSQQERLKLVASRRFRTVESRLSKFHASQGIPLPDIPSDEVLTMQFSACVLGQRDEEALELDCLAPSFSDEVPRRVFITEKDSFAGELEKEWPLGPTLTIEGCWPFVFVCTEPADGGRYWICGIVAVFSSPRKQPLINLPEVTTAFGVLEEIRAFLPSALHPDKRSMRRFMFLLKSALPFGSPVCTNLEILTQRETCALTANDALLSNQTRASLRVPAWKPFPILPNGSSGHLKLHLTESVSFEVLDGEVRMCSVAGRLFCDTDLQGIPEVIVPMHVDLPHQIIVLDDCAKFASSNSQEDVQKISFVPPNEAFTLCSFVMSDPLKACQFPLDLSFKLLQVSPTQFRFSLSGKLRVLFAQFSIMFCASENLPISNLSNLTVSPRCRLDVHNDTHVVWTFRNPSTYSDGESAGGVIETQRPLNSGVEEICRQAVVSFRILNNHFSNVKILKENISFFPTIPKISTSITYETVSSGGCVVLNSALDNGPSVTVPIDLNDCLVIDSVA